MRAWFPTIQGGSGTDVFTRRLVSALVTRGINAQVTWFPSHYQFCPFLLQQAAPPSGTDIIHANSWSGFAFKRKNSPLVITEHHCVLEADYRPYKTFAQHAFHSTLIRGYELASFKKASAITTVSNYTAQSLFKTMGFQAQVIYNWVDTNRYKPNANTRRRNGSFRLLFVGNLSRRKGADLLAPIMNKLGTDFELRFTAGLRRHAGTRYPDNMIPLGTLSDSELVNEYQQCDALLFPSRFEGFGYAALEAMACGKPVVASANSALREVIADKTTGILCPTDDIDAFVSACRWLADSPQRARELGEEGRYRAETVFDEEKIVGQYIALYERLKNQQPGSS